MAVGKAVKRVLIPLFGISLGLSTESRVYRKASSAGRGGVDMS